MIRIRINDTNRIPQAQANLRELNRYAVEIGIFGDSGSSSEGVSYVLIATVHEFGAAVKNIPERSFIRSTFDEKSDDWSNFIKKRISKVLSGAMPARQLYEMLGAKIASDIQTKIKTLQDPPNAASTVKQKGSSNPLIDTGGMRMRVTHRVVAK